MNPESSHEPADSPESETPPIPDEAAADADAAVARRARQGDRAAMEILVTRHHEAVTRLLWRFARSQADLEDLVQETFLRMVRGLPGWRADQPFLHWLFRIATNTGRDYFRRRSVRGRWIADRRKDDPDTPLPEAIDSAPDPAARAAANEIKAMLDLLSPDDRTLLTLHHLEGWGLADIARQFGWTMAATKIRAWRARRQLRDLLQSSQSL